MQKQSLILACACGRSMEFPEGEIRAECQCGAVWILGLGGFWFTDLSISLVAILPKFKPNHYEKYMKKRGKKNGNKNVKSNSEIAFEAAQYQKARIGL